MVEITSLCRSVHCAFSRNRNFIFIYLFFQITKIGYVIHKTTGNNFQVLAGSASFLFASYCLGKSFDISSGKLNTSEVRPKGFRVKQPIKMLHEISRGDGKLSRESFLLLSNILAKPQAQLHSDEKLVSTINFTGISEVPFSYRNFFTTILRCRWWCVRFGKRFGKRSL